MTTRMTLQNHAALPATPAVYRLTFGDRFYIGSTGNLRARMQVHYSFLSNGKALNLKLQAAFDAHRGPTTVEILSTGVEKDRLIREGREIRAAIKSPFCCNKDSITVSGKLIRNTPHPRCKAVMVTLSTGVTRTFSTITQAALFVGTSRKTLARVMKGEHALMAGYDAIVAA